MDTFSNHLINFGEKVTKIKILKVIRAAFQQFMPFTIIGAIATLWTAVICNETNGLGALWPPIMNLDFLNPAFTAVNFCTIGCISIGIALFMGIELGKENGVRPTFAGLLAVLSVFIVSPIQNIVTGDDGKVLATIKGIFENNLSSKGMFTAMIVTIVAVTIFSKLCQIEQLKIKMPDQVPPGISKSFADLIPAGMTVVIISFIGLAVNLLTDGLYLNDLISQFIQKPLMGIGGSLPGFLVFAFLILLFWSVGIHGESMVSGILNPLMTALLLENLAMVQAGGEPTNIINWVFFRIFLCTGGTGWGLALTLAIFIAGKRADNRAIAKVAIVPNLFNIVEVNIFGVPIVLNPILIIPFILAPISCILFGYFMTVIGLCPVYYIQLPWTMPPFLFGFFASGGNFMGGLVQLICLVISTLIYLPFVMAYEKQQNKEDQLRLESEKK